MNKIISLSIFFFSFSLFANDIKVAVISSDIDKNLTDFLITTNDRSEIDSVRFVTKTPSGSVTSDDSYSVEDVMDDGVIIVERDGYDIVVLTSSDFTPQRGGNFKVSYLYNGISGTRKSMVLGLRLLNALFSLFDGDKQINRMFLKANRSPIFGIIGIREIQTSFIANPVGEL